MIVIKVYYYLIKFNFLKKCDNTIYYSLLKKLLICYWYFFNQFDNHIVISMIKYQNFNLR